MGEAVRFVVDATDDKGVEPDQVWVKVGDEYLDLEHGAADFTTLMQGRFSVIENYN